MESIISPNSTEAQIHNIYFVSMLSNIVDSLYNIRTGTHTITIEHLNSP